MPTSMNVGFALQADCAEVGTQLLQDFALTSTRYPRAAGALVPTGQTVQQHLQNYQGQLDNFAPNLQTRWYREVFRPEVVDTRSVAMSCGIGVLIGAISGVVFAGTDCTKVFAMEWALTSAMAIVLGWTMNGAMIAVGEAVFLISKNIGERREAQKSCQEIQAHVDVLVIPHED